MKFIPVYQYIKLNNISKQTAYRWIREKKFDDKEVKIGWIKLKRIRIAENAKPKLSKVGENKKETKNETNKMQ